MRLVDVYYDRFLTKYSIDSTTECWIWDGCRDQDGYGQFHYQKTVRAHRFIYEYIYGPIPDGMTVHHNCGIRECVNPDHLELLSCRDNVLQNGGPTAINAAKTHCKRGHSFDEPNTYVDKYGHRTCRACRKLRKQKSQARYQQS